MSTLRISLPIYLVALTILLINASNTSAHTTIAQKNSPVDFASRTEIEGSSSVFNDISIGHGCSAANSPVTQPVIALSVVFPNSATAISTIDDTIVDLAEHIEGNAIMSPKPVQDNRIFQRISVKRGEVPTFEHHGTRSDDARAFHYNKGYLQTDLSGLLPFQASFPQFKATSCATSLKINLAIANYCTRSIRDADRADIWIGTLTSKFDDEAVVSVGFWPSLVVKRDLENNPLPLSCNDDEVQVVVTPSNEDIDRY
ncbi:MAG: hypothetical protein P8104_03990 [Gammaproteobacteria bacterium]